MGERVPSGERSSATCRAINNALTAVDDTSAAMAPTLDRMRRRCVRHAWQLAAELRGVPARAGVADLTPEDPTDASANTLLNLRAADTRDLVLADLIDRQGRVILTNLNTAQAAAAGALERIRHQPIPAYYGIFVRAVAWFFAVMVVHPAGHRRTRHLGRHRGGGPRHGVVRRRRAAGPLHREPMSNTVFDLPMDRFCATITKDLLGSSHPLAQTHGDAATIWR